MQVETISIRSRSNNPTVIHIFLVIFLSESRGTILYYNYRVLQSYYLSDVMVVDTGLAGEVIYSSFVKIGQI